MSLHNFKEYYYSKHMNSIFLHERLKLAKYQYYQMLVISSYRLRYLTLLFFYMTRGVTNTSECHKTCRFEKKELNFESLSISFSRTCNGKQTFPKLLEN